MHRRRPAEEVRLPREGPVALLIIVLLSGSTVHINPRAITSLFEARNADDKAKLYSPDVRCIVDLANDQEYTTQEECSSIERRITEMKP